MTSIRIFAWLATGLFAVGVAVSPAYALTTMQAPVDSNGSNFADQDDQLQNNFTGGQSNQNQSQSGFHFQIGPGSSAGNSAPLTGAAPPNAFTDPSSPYYAPSTGTFWGPPGMRH